MTSGAGSARTTPGKRRRAARLAAVQGLYEAALSGARIQDLVGAFRARGGTALLEPGLDAEADSELYVDLMTGVADRRDDVQRMASAAVAEGGRRFEQLDLLMQAILMAGTYELLARSDIDPPLTISEYVDVAKAFFAGKESALVNGVLDRIAHTLRPEDLVAKPPDDA